MPSIAIAPGTVVDNAGTGVITPSNSTVTSGGSLVLLKGDVVSAHSVGGTSHPPSIVNTGSATVTVNGKGVAYSGSRATCGGAVTTTFNATVQVGI